MKAYSQDNTSAPLFSICLTTFDRPELLGQTLNSILAQSCTDFEVVLGNNNVECPLSSEALGIDDPRIRIINHPKNLGQVGNLNRLLELAHGRYVTFIADDDLYFTGFLVAVKQALQQFAFPLCVFTSYQLHYGIAKPDLSSSSAPDVNLYRGEEFLRSYLLGRLKAIGCMGVFERNYLNGSGGIEDVSEDGVGLFLEYMLLVRAGLLDKVAYVAEPLIAYRVHETSWGVANTNLERYFRAGNNLVKRGAACLGDGYRGNYGEILLLIFNLALRQILFKTGKANLALDVDSMLAEVKLSVLIDQAQGRHPIPLETMALLMQQFADSETDRIAKEDQLQGKERMIQEQGRDLLEKEHAIQEHDLILQEKERVIQNLAAKLERYKRIIYGIPLLGHLLRAGSKTYAILRPRLGHLHQYPPRPLNLSSLKDVEVPAPVPPRISIVTPSYQQGAFIERTIKSVLEQGYPNLEYIVQDGGSSDQTVSVLKAYERQLAAWRSGKDNGQSQAINLGFADSTGEIMAWLNSDDLLLPGALAYVANYFVLHPEIDVVYGDRLLINEDDLEIGRWIMPSHHSRMLSWADYVPQETLFWRRSVWEKAGGRIDESFHFAMDWDLMVRFRDAGARFAHLPRFLGAFRVHPHQKTSAEINEAGVQEMTRIRERLHVVLPNRSRIRRALIPLMARHVAVDLAYRIKVRIQG